MVWRQYICFFSWHNHRHSTRGSIQCGQHTFRPDNKRTNILVISAVLIYVLYIILIFCGLLLLFIMLAVSCGKRHVMICRPFTHPFGIITITQPGGSIQCVQHFGPTIKRTNILVFLRYVFVHVLLGRLLRVDLITLVGLKCPSVHKKFLWI